MPIPEMISDSAIPMRINAGEVSSFLSAHAPPNPRITMGMAIV